MAVLITGGSGFIGAALAREFQRRGEPVFLFDRKPPPKDLEGVRFLPGDVSNLSEVLNAVEGREIRSVFHLAALLSAPSEANPWAAVQVNAMGTYHVLEAARILRVPKVLFTSSMGVYGVSADTLVDDDTPQRPSLIYGVTKTFGELLGLYYQQRFGVDLRGVRFPQLIGPGVLSGGFGQYCPRMIECALLGQPFDAWVPQETVIPLMYIKDAVRSLVMLHDAPEERVTTRIYNLGQISPPPTAADLAAEVRRHFPGAKIGFVPDPKAESVLRKIPKTISGENARREWDWELAYSLEATVADFIAEFRREVEGRG